MRYSPTVSQAWEIR